jgi:hypothetical protein
MARFLPALIAAALCPLACGPDQGLTAEQQKIVDKAMKSLENAPERVRAEVLRTCDKWKHIDKECVDQEVQMAQMACWLERGEGTMRVAYKRRIRPRARDHSIMRRQNLCMEKRRWRFRVPSGYF